MTVLPAVNTATSIVDADLPTVPGCYVLFVSSAGASSLAIGGFDANTALYVGKADDSIRKRVQQTHLVDGRSGSSTLRRSLGALLRETLLLRPVPRSLKRTDDKRFTNYAFDSESDRRLSVWIAANILVAAVPSPAPDVTERELIVQLAPPLCLTLWDNPHRTRIKQLRATCAAMARAYEMAVTT
jgi:hypothetical protein